MNPDIKRRWVGALRSGHYIQGKGALVDCPTNPSTLEYCCLGVLGCLMHPFKSPLKAIAEVRDREDELLSGDVLEEAGLTGVEQNTLANKNDGGESFAQIADYIEANL